MTERILLHIFLIFMTGVCAYVAYLGWFQTQHLIKQLENRDKLDWFFTRKYGHPMVSEWVCRIVFPMMAVMFICIELIAIFPI